MVQRFKLIGVAVLSILALTIVGATFLQPIYASCLTVTLSSTNITLGTASIMVSGIDNCSGVWEYLYILTGACPPTGTSVVGPVTSTLTGTSFGPTTLTTSSLAQGQYCVEAYSYPTSSSGFTTLTVTSAAPIPEYPLGLAVLAIFMVLAYGVIRRRTRIR
jgi:hypothetical protein